jgi:ABC-type transport system involved in multi-copper enzyme maturation permease subunit
MIWLTWRQHRAVLAVTLVAVVALVAWMLVVQHGYSDASRAIARSCISGQLYAQSSPCTAYYSQQASAWEQADIIRWLLLALPILFGVILGAPLFAGEFERKTVILAFTQSVSRTRWMVIRWLIIGLAVAAFASAVAVLSNWWFGQVPTNGSSFGSRIQPGGSGGFDITGIVPIAYALFAFALGAALGMVLRRTARAIFGTVVLLVTARLLFEQYVRAKLAAPLFLPVTDNQIDPSNFWFVGNGYRGIQFGNFYQPASHYWALQWGEAAIFTAAAAALFGVALWAVRRWRA